VSTTSRGFHCAIGSIAAPWSSGMYISKTEPPACPYGAIATCTSSAL
jgi:hypothetical protein